MSAKCVLAPLITPLTASGEVCEASLRQLLRCLDPHLDGYIPCLTSGEGWRLSSAQWQRMLQLTLAHAGEKKVIAGIERGTTEEVLEFALLAQQLGARAVMFTSPFTAGISQQDIIEHYRTVHDATTLEIFIYNESSLSGNEKTFQTLKAIAELPRVMGLKDSPSQVRTQAQVDVLQAHGVNYFIGWELELAAELESDGSVVSIANLEPFLCRLASIARQPVLRQHIARLNESYALGDDHWYAQIKRELKARGVIACDRQVKEGDA